MPAKTIWLIMMDICLPEHGPHNRHFWFAKHLKERGYNPLFLLASRERGNALQMIEDDAPFKVDDSYGFPFVYIRIKITARVDVQLRTLSIDRCTASTSDIDHVHSI